MRAGSTGGLRPPDPPCDALWSAAPPPSGGHRGGWECCGWLDTEGNDQIPQIIGQVSQQIQGQQGPHQQMQNEKLV